MDSKTIAVILAGGTIGMVRGRDGILRPAEDPKDFVSVIPELHKELPIDFSVVMNKDSTDMAPADWVEIANAIYNKIITINPKGIVVIHGVDTICFTASAVSYALGPGLNCPVVFTGAQVPVDRIHGDGKINLIRSIEVASKSDICEVMILFNNKAFRGNRAQKKDDKDFDALESLVMPPLVSVKEPLEIHRLGKRRLPPYEIELKFVNKFLSGILPIPLIPGNTWELQAGAMRSEYCKGVILFSFGGFTVPNIQENDYLPFIKEAIKRGKPVLIASHYPTITTEYSLYESGSKAESEKAIPVSGYVLPALVAKFSWILALTIGLKDDFKKRHELLVKVMSNPYVGEITMSNDPDIFCDGDILTLIKNL